jgi:nickel-dependent lactate racemase
MQVIKVPQLAWYGTRELELPVPDNWQVEICNMAGYNRAAMSPQQIKTAVAKPINIPPIRELARGKNEVVIIFDDMSRVTRAAQIIPSVLEELAEAGISDSRIRFIVALGAHGALDRLDFVKKLGEETLGRFPVYNHNAFGNCTYVGKTSTYGTEVYVNEEVMKCDLKIAIGSVVPHPMSGFGGGGKIILPGVVSFETIKQNHESFYRTVLENLDKPVTGMGLFDDNPMRVDIEEAAVLAGLDVVINCIVNTWGETVAVFAGALVPTYAAAVNEARTHYRTPNMEGKNIVITNSFSKPNEAFLGLNIAYRAVSREGGDVVLIANAPEGQVTHYLLGTFGLTEGGPLRQPPRIPPFLGRLIVYTEYPDVAGRGWIPQGDNVLFLHNWDDVLQGLQESHGADTRVAVYPNADIQYCV